MSLDKLVDSTQLDTDLASVANAIRTKGGTSAQLAFPAGFVSAIQAIPSGGGGGDPAWFSKVSAIGFNLRANVNSRIITGDVVFDFGNLEVDATDFLWAVGSTQSNTTVELKCGSVSRTYRALNQNAMSSNKNIKTVIFTCSSNPVVSTEFARGTTVTRILGTPLLCTDFLSGTYRAFNSANLTEFYLVPNKVIAGGGGISTGVLADASLVSVANALSGTATGQTLTISNATTKAKCDTIMGTVSQVTDGGETYDFFTADPQGTVSLASFITSTKGWTLA